MRRRGTPDRPTAAHQGPDRNATRGPRVGLVAYGDDASQLHVLDLATGSSVVVSDSAAGYPERPVAVDDTFVFVADGAAHVVVRAGAPGVPTFGRRQLVAADHVLPSSSPDKVLIVHGNPPGPVDVEAIDLDGTRRGERLQLPAGTTPVTSVALGLVTLRADGNLAVFDAKGNTIAELGIASDVIAAHGDLVAWLDGPRTACTNGCKLHITRVRLDNDTTRMDDRGLAAPTPSDGWINGGAIAPGGRHIAAFVLAPDSVDGGPGAQLVIVDTETATAHIVPDSDVGIGESVIAASWSTASGWLLYSGLRGRMRAFRLTEQAPVELDAPGATYVFAAT